MQQEIELNKLYEISKVRKVTRNASLGINPIVGEGMGQGEPRISIYGGSVNVYGSDDILNQPTSISAMILDAESLEGVHVFRTLPDFLYLTGTATNVVVSGAIYNEIGEFE